MKKELILAVVATFFIAGLAGFYGGRFYERRTTRNRFTQMRQNIGQNQGRGNGFFMNGEGPSRNYPSSSPSQPAITGAGSSAPSSK